jgi:hypothetical protein
MDAPGVFGVDDFNQAVVASARSEVYCHPDDLDRLEVLDLPNPNRPLIEMSGGEWLRGSTDGVNSRLERRRHRRYRRATPEELRPAAEQARSRREEDDPGK